MTAQDQITQALVAALRDQLVAASGICADPAAAAAASRAALCRYEGFNAARAGQVPNDACPWPFGGPQAEAWKEGHRMAQAATPGAPA